MKTTITRHVAHIYSDEDTPLSVCWSGSVETHDAPDELNSMDVEVDEIHYIEVAINGQGYLFYSTAIPKDKLQRLKNQIIDEFEQFEVDEEEYDPNFNGNRP